MSSLSEASDFMRRVLNCSVAFLGILELDGRLVEVTDTALVVGGVAAADVMGKPFWDCWWWNYSPKVQAELRSACNRALTGETVRYDVQVRIAGGALLWIDFQLAPLRADDGSITHLIPSAVEITARKAAEEQVQSLLEEVNHRSKNLLMVVQSMARLSARGDQTRGLDTFSARLAALAAAHDLLVANSWSGVDLRDLVLSQLSFFQNERRPQVSARGPECRLLPAAAQFLGIALFELATNSAKYGSLSVDSGTVDVDWCFETCPSSNFVMSWRERGGPLVTTPEREGFGTLVTTKGPVASLGAQVKRTFESEGLFWMLRCPIDRVVARTSKSPKPELPNEYI